MLDPITPGGTISILGQPASVRQYRPPIPGAQSYDGVAIAQHNDGTMTVTWGGHLYCATADRRVVAERANYARSVAKRWIRNFLVSHG